MFTSIYKTRVQYSSYTTSIQSHHLIAERTSKSRGVAMTQLLGPLIFLGIFIWSFASGLQPTVDKRQADVCVAPTDDPNYPQQCLEALANLYNEMESLDINQPPQELNETSMTFSNMLSVYCTELCLQPQIDYFDCTGDTASIKTNVDGVCSQIHGRFCIPKIFDGMISSDISPLVYDPVFLQDCTTECTSDCLNSVQSAINYLGCCAYGVFSVEASEVLASCNISQLEPCPSDFGITMTTPTLPLESCIYPGADPNYPTECVDALNSTNAKLTKLASANYTPQEVDEALESFTDILAMYCSSKCFQPTLDYLECQVGNTETEESLASFQCGQNDGTFCLLQTLEGLSAEIIPVDVLDPTFAQTCTTNCTSQCAENINSLVGYLGCCSRGFLPNVDVFESCNLATPDNCPITSIAAATPIDRTTSTSIFSSAPSSTTAATHTALAFLLATIYITSTEWII